MGKSNTLKRALSDYASKTKHKLLDSSHFLDFRHNVFGGRMDDGFIEMFVQGDGNELVLKAAAVHSSSMLSYNFFHWVSKEYPLVIDGVAYDNVMFEVKMPVLKGTRAANMDVVLTSSSGHCLFIESKFTEYLSSGDFKISDTYRKCPDKYHCRGKEWTRFIEEYDTSKKEQYWDGIKQEICHMIALNNWLSEKTKISSVSLPEDRSMIRFFHLLFKPGESYKEELAAFEAYQARYAELHGKLKEKGLLPAGVDSKNISFKTYSDIWDCFMSNTLPEGLKEYLEEHYMQFAASRMPR